MVNQRYRNCYQEVYIILEHLEYEDYQKIPQTVLNAIDNNRNKNYPYKFRDDIELKMQPMMPEAKATLYNLYRDYLCTSEQKQIIKKFQKAERVELEKRKLEKNNNYSFNQSNEKTIEKVEEPTKSNLALTKIEKESLFSKCIRKIKQFFCR